ncbi:SsrA-binding protein SmpB [Mucisphaera calidilacus]|uniref:SsrA-binding protein n=1 Tax=Mucisphaera calidilacus TaxID=2527982 RepID=A0A518BVJ6_9BACT|nr:SsrA-binding protein SmpB [Mucisphaera calidilacus]QDU70981.1 SsrA-binding protein [Mucisphaera calidilacus]
MAKRKPKPENFSPRIENRRARHDYHIVDKLEVGIKLLGTEIKSIRNSQVSLAEGYATIDNRSGELLLLNVDIAQYKQAGVNQHAPRRPRLLLAHKREIKQLEGRLTAKGTTLVPLAIYFVRGRAKLLLGVGEGKKQHDKRQDLKTKDAKRDMQRAMTRRRI